MVSHFGDEVVKTLGLESEICHSIFSFLSRVKKFLNDFPICFWPRPFGGIWSELAEAKTKGV